MKDIYEKQLIFKIAAAVSMADIEIYHDEGFVKMPPYDDRYKYAQTVEVDGERVAMCSKDLVNWSLCIAVKMENGEEHDAEEFKNIDYIVRNGQWGGNE